MTDDQKRIEIETNRIGSIVILNIEKIKEIEID